MQYDVLFSFLIASIALTFMPGPDIIYVMLQSITNGKKYGIITALGLVSGIIIHTSLVAFGVSALLTKYEIVYTLLKIAGGVYVLYLAWMSYQSNETINLNDTISKKSLVALYKQGFIMNVLNPKVTIFFVAFFPGFLFSNTLSTVAQFYILGALFILQAFLIFTIVSVAAGSFSTYLTTHKHFSLQVKWFKITVFIAIAGYLFFS